MTRLENYLEDGANWQAQAVLAYLKGQKEDILDETWNKEHGYCEGVITIGRYENCREQGYVFSIIYKGNQRNYAVYEHRNSDTLCVVVFDKQTINAPTLDEVVNFMKDKYDVTDSFSCGDIKTCGDYITEDMKNFISTVKDLQIKEDE